MRALLANIGTSGDLDPVVGLGKELQSRGHETYVVTVGHFRRLVEGAGLHFVDLEVDEAYAAFIDSPDLWNPKRSFVALAGLMRACLEPLFLRLEELRNEQTVLAAGAMAMGARLAQEKFGLPLATLNMQPWAFFHHPQPILEKANAMMAPTLAPVRAQLGLPPVEDVFGSWFQSPQSIVGFFPDWYAPDLEVPDCTTFAGFPLYDEAGVEEIEPELEAWLEAGEPPLIFTFGTGMTHCEALFAQCAEVCRGLGRRGILLARHLEQLPGELPEGVRGCSFIPFGQVLPRALALVHHGGIGTVSQALKAGIPQLIVPFSHDQPDNAGRLSKLGVAEVLPPDQFLAPAAQALLEGLLGRTARCQELAGRFRGMDGLGKAADALEKLAMAGCDIG